MPLGHWEYREMDVPDGWGVEGRYVIDAPMVDECRVYWGLHGCRFARGHVGKHECDCCECDDHAKHPYDAEGAHCPAKAPYYGPDTHFFGEDAN